MRRVRIEIERIGENAEDEPYEELVRIVRESNYDQEPYEYRQIECVLSEALYRFNREGCINDLAGVLELLGDYVAESLDENQEEGRLKIALVDAARSLVMYDVQQREELAKTMEAFGEDERGER